MLAEWLLGENGNESIFRRLLVLRIHAHVINLVGSGGIRICIHDKFRASTAQRCAVEYTPYRCSHLYPVDTVGNDDRIEIQQCRIRGDVKVNVRLRPRGIGRNSANTPMRGIESVSGMKVTNAALVKPVVLVTT